MNDYYIIECSIKQQKEYILDQPYTIQVTAGIKENEARQAYETLLYFLGIIQWKGSITLYYPWRSIIHRMNI